MRNERCLILDIETRPIVSLTWGTREQNIALNQIQSDWNIIAWAAKWLGDPASKTIYRDLRKSKPYLNDKKILQDLWKLLDEADIVITQNGKNFDIPKINARLMLNGIRPYSPIKHLDTYQIARRVAKFTSNKLEYLTGKLCTKYKKLSHSKFPGQVLWNECLRGNIAAWKEMEKYNRHDVLATEELYNVISAWTPKSMPKIHKCVNPAYRSNGLRTTSTGSYRRLVCVGCNEQFQEHV